MSCRQFAEMEEEISWVRGCCAEGHKVIENKIPQNKRLLATFNFDIFGPANQILLASKKDNRLHEELESTIE